ncbi:MAG TPA: hypothetical protein VFQ79_15135 [Bryobacteraceae bacterium]|nr:hypothetical protein [Bryobacteraceae bacterium]
MTAGAPAVEEPLRKGTTVGRYDVAAPLGRGGMGEVYIGWEESPAFSRMANR